VHGRGVAQPCEAGAVSVAQETRASSWHAARPTSPAASSRSTSRETPLRDRTTRSASSLIRRRRLSASASWTKRVVLREPQVPLRVELRLEAAGDAGIGAQKRDPHRAGVGRRRAGWAARRGDGRSCRSLGDPTWSDRIREPNPIQLPQRSCCCVRNYDVLCLRVNYRDPCGRQRVHREQVHRNDTWQLDPATPPSALPPST